VSALPPSVYAPAHLCRPSLTPIETREAEGSRCRVRVWLNHFFLL
jgi:hypothetical protein